MAVSVTTSIEMAGELVTVAVQPKREYTHAGIRIKGRGVDIELLVDEEQLAEIGYAIQQHQERTRSHETPDQQLIMNQEIEEETHETYRAS